MKAETILLLAVGAYLFMNWKGGVPQAAFQTCKYPDGTTIAVPVGNACPNDPTHGGQSFPCFSSSFIGPTPPGSVYC